MTPEQIDMLKWKDAAIEISEVLANRYETHYHSRKDISQKYKDGYLECLGLILNYSQEKQIEEKES